MHCSRVQRGNEVSGNAEIYASNHRVGAGRIQVHAAGAATKPWIPAERDCDHGEQPGSSQRLRRFGSFHGGSLNEIERQVVLLTNAVAIKCPLTVAIHSTFAIEDGIAESEVKAVRDGKLPRDPKYAALSALAKTLIETRGNVTEADVEKFTSAGYSRVQILEVITAVGVSTLAATTANMAGTPVDRRFKAQTWSAA
jgi:alkylhydroperoxidase family enzyme